MPRKSSTPRISRWYLSTLSLEERFWLKVDRAAHPRGCWLWVGGTDGRGYGVFCLGTKPRSRFIRAHRFAYELRHGPIPDGMFACHRCDTPGCVNPDHIFLGTPADNIDDMRAKGRGFDIPNELKARGEQHTHAKLTDAIVRELRERHEAGGMSIAALALQYGVSRESAGDAINRRTWKHVA